MNGHGPIIKMLFAAYPQAQVSDATVAVYLRLLQDIPPADLRVTVEQAIVDSKFLPTIAELRDRYRVLTVTLTLPSSAEAWGVVQKAIRRYGSWGRPDFDDPIVARAVDIMGWVNLCQSEGPEGVDRAQFMRIYESLATRRDQVGRLLPASRQMAMERLPGGMQHIAALLPLAANGDGNGMDVVGGAA